MKKKNFKKCYLKILLILMISILFMSIIPSIQYATTDKINFPIRHTLNKFLTSVGAITLHQDKLIAYIETDKTIDTSIANYRTQYGVGEKLKVKISFSGEIEEVNNAKLVLQFGESQERVLTQVLIENDYMIFEYTLTNDDNGELNFKSLNGTVKRKRWQFNYYGITKKCKCF